MKFTELEQAVEEAAASPQGPEVRDTESRQFTVFVHCIFQFVNILFAFSIVPTLKKVPLLVLFSVQLIQ